MSAGIYNVSRQVNLFEFLINEMSVPVGHFVLSSKGREKSDRIATCSRCEERREIKEKKWMTVLG